MTGAKRSERFGEHDGYGGNEGYRQGEGYDACEGPGAEGSDGGELNDGADRSQGTGAPGNDGADQPPRNDGADRPEGTGVPGTGGSDGTQGPGAPGGGGGGSAPRIPLPRSSVEDNGLPLPDPAHSPELPAPPPLSASLERGDPHEQGGPPSLVLEHRVLKSLLGAWALAACSPEETAAVEAHLGDCGPCADEARRLREAVGLLQRPESLDLDPGLRTRVLASCLGRRPPRIPVPEWAAPYDAETARLDALLQDIGDAEWHAPVRLRWFDGTGPASRRTTVAGVIAHLLSVDGLVAMALGIDDPLGDLAGEDGTPQGRTEAYWRTSHFPPTRSVRPPWREQNHNLVRTVSFTDGRSEKLAVSYGEFELPLQDAMLDRAFECWVHAEDIAGAVDYPYDPPAPRHLNMMFDLAVRMLPLTLAARRRAGLAKPSRGARHLVPAGEPGRTLRLEIEGSGGGEWLVPLDSPGAVASAEREVAHVALDGVEFCRLAAGHIPPEEAVAGQVGDREAIRDVLFAAASLSRM